MFNIQMQDFIPICEETRKNKFYISYVSLQQKQTVELHR